MAGGLQVRLGIMVLLLLQLICVRSLLLVVEEAHPAIKLGVSSELIQVRKHGVQARG